jgi:transposase-like protein
MINYQPKVGRPFETFTPERREAILLSISKRIPYEIAAESNGISERRLYQWIKQGRKDLDNGKCSEHAQFAQAIKKIEEEKMLEHLTVIQAMPERWQAHAWMLERRWWKYFSPNAALVEFNKRLDEMEDSSQGESDDEVNDCKTQENPQE